MKTHAPQVDTASVAARVAQLPHLPMDSLWALWDEHFDERPNHHHRTLPMAVWPDPRSSAGRACLALRIGHLGSGGDNPGSGVSQSDPADQCTPCGDTQVRASTRFAGYRAGAHE